MTVLETLLLLGGVISLLLFLHRSAFPWLRGRLDRAAVSTSATLREELLFLSPSQARLALLALCAIPGICVAILVRSPWAGPAAGLACALFSGLLIRTYRNRRRKRIASQLPALLDILTGQLQAGHSLPESLQDAIPLLPRGVREEVAWIFQRIRIGTPVSEALTHWEKRLPCEEVVLFVRPLNSALSTGSDVANLLSRCRDILQAKLLVEGRLRSMTAQGRLQAIVLTLLPPGFILVLSRIDPEYLPRCLGTAPGLAILSVAAILQLLGWLCIRKIMAETP